MKSGEGGPCVPVQVPQRRNKLAVRELPMSVGVSRERIECMWPSKEKMLEKQRQEKGNCSSAVAYRCCSW